MADFTSAFSISRALLRLRVFFQVLFERADEIDGARPGFTDRLGKLELLFGIACRIERGRCLRLADACRQTGQTTANT